MDFVCAFGPASCLGDRKVLSVSPDTDVLVLGNHGLVIGGNDCGAVDFLSLLIPRGLREFSTDSHLTSEAPSVDTRQT